MTAQSGTAAATEPKPIIVQVLFVQNAEAIARLKELKSLQKQGLITEAQYQE